jgi:hypothetical protein
MIAGGKGCFQHLSPAIHLKGVSALEIVVLQCRLKLIMLILSGVRTTGGDESWSERSVKSKDAILSSTILKASIHLMRILHRMGAHFRSVMPPVLGSVSELVIGSREFPSGVAP